MIIRVEHIQLGAVLWYGESNRPPRLAKFLWSSISQRQRMDSRRTECSMIWQSECVRE